MRQFRFKTAGGYMELVEHDTVTRPVSAIGSPPARSTFYIGFCH